MYTFDYRPLPDGRAELVRAYGDSPVLALPETLPDARAGGALPLAALGDYCFAETPRALPPAGALCRCELNDTGAARLLDPDGQAGGQEGLHPLAGRFLEELALPDALRLIGSCAFYNCRSLRRLTAGGGALTLGSDVFLNCFSLTELVLRAGPDAPTGLPALVNNSAGSLRALFAPEKEIEAAFRYPEYWEDIEETPAHILLHTFSGQGYHYRQCFRDGRLLSAEYDAVFAQGHGGDAPAFMALLCFDRLRWPWQLGERARGLYRAFLAEQSGAVAAQLLRAQDLDGLRALLALGVMDTSALAEASALARRAGDAQAAALLADAEYETRAAAPRPKRRYTFDF